MRNTCSTCKFYEWDMTCHRYPPVHRNQYDEAAWPYIRKPTQEWCGEHQPNTEVDT